MEYEVCVLSGLQLGVKQQYHLIVPFSLEHENKSHHEEKDKLCIFKTFTSS